VSFLRHALPVFCILGLAAGAGRLSGDDERATALSPAAPVINFSVPTFTREGNRSWLLRGSEGLYVNANQLEVKNLNLTVFTGDATNRVESVFLSPAATALINDSQVRGPGLVRLICEDFEATGEDWLYDHRQKKVSIRKSVRVVFHSPLRDILR